MSLQHTLSACPFRKVRRNPRAEVNRSTRDLLLLCREVHAQILQDCLTFFFDEAAACQGPVLRRALPEGSETT